MLARTGQLVATLLLLLLGPALVCAQDARGVVVDQTNLPLPGVRIEIFRDDRVVDVIVTDSDGTFELPAFESGDRLEASLDGFETAKVAPADARRITMVVGRTTEVTEVVASALTSSGAAMERLGSTMSAPLAQRLPTPRPHILQALPLLPSVVRGRDGQLRIGGTRPHESSLWIDGFDVTDPVTGTTRARPARRERERHGGAAGSDLGDVQRRARFARLDRDRDRRRGPSRRASKASSRGPG